ncbi:MAG: hypothetical protein Q8O14_06880 [bacterium]|jgi:selenium metabolism protein YedF|nr:hypothetical protein [bacterium]
MTFLYLSSDHMGEGDLALGRKLLKSFLAELAASGTPVDLIGCVNHGVLLTTEGSPVLAELQALEAAGARIASCGTCLDALELREQLRLGMVGSMDMTVKVMSTADRVIRP